MKELTTEIVNELYEEYEDTVVVKYFKTRKQALVDARLQDETGVWGYDTGDLIADATLSLGFISFCIARGYAVPINGN